MSDANAKAEEQVQSGEQKDNEGLHGEALTALLTMARYVPNSLGRILWQ